MWALFSEQKKMIYGLVSIFNPQLRGRVIEISITDQSYSTSEQDRVMRGRTFLFFL